MSSRTTQYRRGAFASLALASVFALVACSSTPSEAPANPDPSSPSAGETSELLELVGANPDALGGDLTIPVGINVALSGQGAYFGDVMVKAAELAATQIREAGGPNFELSIKDHASGDAALGVQTTREFAQEGINMALYSYIAVLGSALAPIEEFQILSLDGGGGTQEFAKGMPYFYGTRATAPNDTFSGTAQYIAEALPEVSRVSIIIGDTGAENTADSIAKAEAELKANGIELVASEIVTYGGTDFSSAVSRIVASDTELLISAQYGTDTGYLLRQLRDAGSELPVIGVDFIPDAVEIAGSAADGFIFSLDFFDAANPTNRFGEYMVETAAEAYPDLVPDYYFANYYQDMFTLWEVVQRVVADGGEVTDSETILAAFESNLTFPSVYGGNPGDPSGFQTIDPESHSLSDRTMGVFQYDGGVITPLATYGIGGVDFALIQ